MFLKDHDQLCEMILITLNGSKILQSILNLTNQMD